jgi:hypothetical protein
MATTEAPRPETKTTLSIGELRTTRYSDVCGGTDELKRILTEEPERVNTPEGRAALRGLVDDGLYMLARMEVRLREYQAFRDELARIVEHMRGLDEPRLRDAAQEADRLRAILSRDGDLPLQEIADRAEEIRQVANDMEGALRRHKEACIAAGRAYLQLKGARDWEDGSRALPGPSASANGHPTQTAQATQATQAEASAPADHEPLPPWIPEAWLPPPPHREKIVDWLKRGRAALLSDEEVDRLPVGPQGREPLVQFEDGGFMPLRVVRWNEEVRNFHPLGQDPHPRGRLYRKRAAGPTTPPSEE